MDLDTYRKKLQETQFSYSQCLQDSFALFVNNYKFGGVCVDIGSATPTSMFNNTKLLQLYKWKCIGADQGNYYKDWEGYPYFKFFQDNCTRQEAIDSLFFESGNDVDFLSLDIDDNTIDALKLIDFNKIQVKCICIEHNKYLGSRGEQRHEQRKILKKFGYKIIVKNFHDFEDWWYNPKFINYEDIKQFNSLSETRFTIDMNLEEILPNHQDKINNDRSKFCIQTLNKLK